jgi:outer membrane protein OmpA-like peptidoglycan-associated protein
MNDEARTLALFGGCLLVPALLEVVWLSAAAKELKAAEGAASEVAIASASEDEYCSPNLKRVLRRVAGACGLLSQSGGRGCKPGDAKTVAAVSGDDFNALFRPLSHRAALVQFDPEVVDLDDEAKSLVEKSWSDQRGASFFFVVARASSDGSKDLNQKLSQQRAESVLTHLETRFKDPDLRSEVGLLWLGEEFAPLGEEFCTWNRSRIGECSAKEINRSAFVAWIDCAI